MALDPITGAENLVGSVIDRIWPNATDALKAKAALATLASTGELKKMALQAGLAQGQISINKAEALSGNVFIAGGRPFLIWVCGAAFSWAFVLKPIVASILAASGSHVILPTLDLSAMMPVLLTLLGFGGMRTVEKINKVEQRHG